MKYIAYHGSKSQIEYFSLDFVGGGNDEYGGGIYFMENEHESNQYGNFIHKVELNGRFLNTTTKIDNKHKMLLINLIKSASNYKESLMDWGENLNYALNMVISVYMDFDSFFEVVQSIEADFWRGYTKEFCQKMTKLRVDGFRIDRNNHNDFFVVYNPQSIKILSIDERK